MGGDGVDDNGMGGGQDWLKGAPQIGVLLQNLPMPPQAIAVDACLARGLL
jgi:hypothetical protein